MKLLQTMAGGDVGGAEEFFVRLAIALDRRGFDQHLVVRQNDARNARLADAGLSLIEVPFGGALDRRSVPAVAQEIDAFAPNLVLSWMSRATAVTGKALSRAGKRPVHVGRLGGYYDLKYYDACDHLIGNTPDIVRYLADAGWSETKAHFVPNFVHADMGTKLDRAGLGVPEDAPLMLAAGRLHPNKAFDVLLTAMKRVPDVWLLLAGDGGAARDLEVLGHKLGVAGRVRFLGWRDDMADLMATADMLVCPSRIEPLGNVVIEAWARGLPVVAAASQGPAWLIRDGEDGLLAPVEDATALAAAIQRLSTDRSLAELVARQGRQRFDAEFTEEAVLDRFVALFEELAG